MQETINLYAPETDAHIARIELWYDRIPEDAEVATTFDERWHHFQYDAEYEQYSGLILDSSTGLADAYYNHAKFKGRIGKEADIASSIKGRIGPTLRAIANTPIPVVVCCHLSREYESGTDIDAIAQYWPRLPGTLRSDSKGMFGEVYLTRFRFTKSRDDNGTKTVTRDYVIQANESDSFVAFSQLEAVKDMGEFDAKSYPYAAVAKAAKEAGNPFPHILLCGEPGTGKSTWAATMIRPKVTKPVLVLMFDPRDKATPYMKRGVVK